MNTFQWVVYGLDTFGYVIIETEDYNWNNAHKKAVTLCEEKGLDFDTVEPFDQEFVRRMGWLKD